MEANEAISPIDGRYRKYTEPLAKFFSEFAFIKYRVLMESRYLELFLKTIGQKPKKIHLEVTDHDAEEIKKIEQTTNHDLKAIEYWMRSKLPKKLGNWIHFGLTSEDATNIAYGLMVTGALKEVLIPSLEKITKTLYDLRYTFRATPMLARTHGQPASPTTFGKEMAIFAARLERQLEQIKAWRAPGKLAGATGNYNALVAAYPKIDWQKFSKKFVESFKLEHTPLVTQIESHDGYAELFDMLRRINTILINFDQDIWRYVSDGWLKQRPVEGEVGSSTMPHKINPWLFENSEGNLGLANALFAHFSAKLPISRLQRDLSDSTVERSIGVAFGHALIGYEYLLKALERIDVNEPVLRQALSEHPEVLAEAIQTILRREGVAMPYEKLKELTRGKVLMREDLSRFIDELPVSAIIKQELRSLDAMSYVGLAEQLA